MWYFGYRKLVKSSRLTLGGLLSGTWYICRPLLTCLTAIGLTSRDNFKVFQQRHELDGLRKERKFIYQY
jgi:hypothetical protein